MTIDEGHRKYEDTLGFAARQAELSRRQNLAAEKAKKEDKIAKFKTHDQTAAEVRATMARVAASNAEAAQKKADKFVAKPHKYIPTSKSDLTIKSDNLVAKANTTQDTRYVNNAVSAAERAIMFGSPKAIEFLHKDPVVVSKGFYADGTPEPTDFVDWRNVKKTYDAFFEKNTAPGAMIRSTSKDDRIAAWVYMMENKFSHTHKLTHDEQVIAQQHYLATVNEGRFPPDEYFAHKGGVCVLM